MTQLNLHLMELLCSRMALEYYTHTGDTRRAEFWRLAAKNYATIYALALDIYGGGK